MHRPTRALYTAAFAAATLLAAFTSLPAEAGGRLAIHTGKGSVVGAARQGPNGGGFARGRVVTGDGQGNAHMVSGGVFRGPNGGSGARIGEATSAADGSLSRRGGFQASNANGSIAGQGSATLGADGSLTQSRTTTATGAAGNSYSGSTSYSKETGVVHSGTCSDPSGNVIPCR